MYHETFQSTIAAPFTVDGVGVHSGAATRLTVRPAAANAGICFVRTDITDQDNIIPARWDLVTETQLCTVLTNGAGISISTVEHVLSALAGYGIDNAVIEVDGPEIPIMDGSAADFVAKIEQTGRKAQNASRKVLRVTKTVSYEEDGKAVYLTPADSTFYSLEIDFDNALIGKQKYALELRQSSYKREISAARTFGFLHEVEYLRKIGLARGGSLENAIVIDGDKVLNPTGLRFGNEFVRHKILDAIGDLYLAGGQLLGHYHGVKSGHALNNKALRALFAQPDAYEWVTLSESVDMPYQPDPASRQPVAFPVSA